MSLPAHPPLFTAPFRFFLLLILALPLLGACAGSVPPEPAPPKFEIATAEARPAAPAAELPGRIAALRTAEVRARVAGIVLRRQFDEGSEVQAGQVLFQIDPAPLRAAAARARGELAKTQAELEDARAQAGRYAELAPAGAVSSQDLDSAKARLKAAQAAQLSANAEVDSAELDLSHATVRAPISGRIGRALVSEGALVGQGEATPLALIEQLHPIYADFSRPLGDVLRLRAEAAAQGTAPEAQVSLEIPELAQRREGRLLFADMRVDPDTGTVALRAEFANADGLLLPGMFVRVQTAPHAAAPQVYVPQRAIRRAADGSASLIVVGADGLAATRAVRTGQMDAGQWQILEGLMPGERFVASGTDKVAPGMPLAAAVAATH